MPTPDGYLLSERDILMLRRLLSQYNHEQRYVNAFGRPPEDAIDHEETSTTHFHIAKTPSGGIPPLTVFASTGVGDQPGSADCQILRTNPNTAPESAENITGFTQKVYNLSESAITGEQWIFVIRDKYGKYYAISSSGSSGGFPVELTAGYDVTTGYPWRRIQLQDDGTFTDHDPVQTGDEAYTPDENHDLGNGTRGWLFPNPDRLLAAGTGTSTAEPDTVQTYIFIPVYKTRTHCNNGNLVFQTSTDGGLTWVDTEDLSADCGTAGQSEPITVGGCGWVAGLRPDDCLELTVIDALGRCSGIDGLQSLILAWNVTVWESGVSTPGTSGTDIADDYFYYINGSATVRFSVDSYGVPHLQIGNEYLTWDKCGTVDETGEPVIDFSGGSITQCGTAAEAECSANYFTVRIKCVVCPTLWYCVATSGTCEGVGTGNVIEILELTIYEAQVLAAYICHGPFSTEAEAISACSDPLPCPELSGTGFTLTLNVSSTLSCLNGFSKALTWTGTLWGDGNSPSPCSTDVGFALVCSGDNYEATYNGCPLTFSYASAVEIVFIYDGTGTAACPPLGGEYSTFQVAIS